MDKIFYKIVVDNTENDRRGEIKGFSNTEEIPASDQAIKWAGKLRRVSELGKGNNILVMKDDELNLITEAVNHFFHYNKKRITHPQAPHIGTIEHRIVKESVKQSRELLQKLA